VGLKKYSEALPHRPFYTELNSCRDLGLSVHESVHWNEQHGKEHKAKFLRKQCRKLGCGGWLLILPTKKALSARVARLSTEGIFIC
jgi:hypothetical protein